MRKLLLSCASIFILVSSAVAFAQPPFSGEPDITLSGIEFNKISGYYPDLPDPLDPDDEGQEGCTWYRDGTAIFTKWDHGGDANHLGHCFWVLYFPVELTPGYWRFGLNAINRNPAGAGVDPETYPRFEVLVELEAPSLDWGSGVAFVPASDLEVKSGYAWFRIREPGLYAVKYTWLNDDSGPGWDANIMISSVFFDEWPPGRGQ